jgi:hypothetical protein
MIAFSRHPGTGHPRPLHEPNIPTRRAESVAAFLDDGAGTPSRLTGHRLTLNHARQWARGYVAFLPAR